MITILTWKASSEKDDWGFWNNTYYFQDSLASTKDEARVAARKVLEFEGGLHRVDTSFICAAIQMSGQNSDLHYATASTQGAGRAFNRPLNGMALWRHALGVRKQVMFGKHPHLRYSNCLGEGDVYRDVEGRIALVDRNGFDAWIDNKYQNDYDQIWRHEVTLKKSPIPFAQPDPVPVLRRYGAFAIDQHANTRWRRRASANGLTAFGKVSGALIAGVNQVNDNIEVIAFDIDFVPEAYFTNTVTILGAGKKLLDDVEAYLDDADQDANNGQVAAKTRFGTTSANIRKGLVGWANFAENDLPELLKVYKPEPYIDGRSYIKSRDLKVYDDVLRDFLDDASVGWFFDWRNPRAYEANSENWLPDSTPDMVELDW